MNGARAAVDGPAKRSGPSLKARALRWLAQREHSRVELRRKLMPYAVEEAPATAAPDNAAPVAAVANTAAAMVDAVLDWLEAERYLSSERFVESRVAARRERFGSLRIAQELKQHRLALPVETLAALRASELERARALLQRRHPEPPADAAERARRARFLAGRGFAPEVIGRLLREGDRRVGAESTDV